MNYIYDLVLNFTNVLDFLEFYEWSSTDSFTYIEKIPIYVVNDTSFIDICNSLIRIDKSLLKEIKNKTYTNNGKIKYSLLVTDRIKVIALKFNDEGLLIEKSSLLIDEEDAVVEEASLLTFDIFNYEIIKSIDNNIFLTRHEKYLKKYLLEEINNLYVNKIYDELNYLYYEIYEENISIKDKYNKIIEIINNNSFDKISYLYEIIKLAKEKSY